MCNTYFGIDKDKFNDFHKKIEKYAYGNPSMILPDINILTNQKSKPHFELEIEAEDDLSKIKALETAIIKFNDYNLKINVSDDYLKSVRFAIRKTIDEDETGYYTDLETAKACCPPGYSVFDVITRQEVFTVFKDEFKSEDAKYKKMWKDLQEHIKDHLKRNSHILIDDYYIGLRDGHKLVLNAMKDFEGEMLNNE